MGSKEVLCTRCYEPLPQIMVDMGFPDKTHISQSKCIENLQERVRVLEKQLKARQKEMGF